jgi:hypothetical protein
LDFDSDYDIFDQLIDYRGDGHEIPIQTEPIPPQMSIVEYWDEGTRKTRDDAFGHRLTFVYVKQLKELKVPNNASSKNKAIKAFINALPDDTPIILMWR